MAKQAKAMTNSYDGVTVDRFVKRVTECWDRLDELTGEHMNRCQKVRKQIGGIIEEAKIAGIPKMAFKPLLKIEELIRRANRIKADQEKEVIDELRQIAEARQDHAQLNMFGWVDLTPAQKAKQKELRRKKYAGVSGDELPASEASASEPEIGAAAGNA